MHNSHRMSPFLHRFASGELPACLDVVRTDLSKPADQRVWLEPPASPSGQHRAGSEWRPLSPTLGRAAARSSIDTNLVKHTGERSFTPLADGAALQCLLSRAAQPIGRGVC